MARPEEFADPVLVPGPNVRSRYVDTEEVGPDSGIALEESELQHCPACGRRFAGATLVCPDDGVLVSDSDPAGGS